MPKAEEIVREEYTTKGGVKVTIPWPGDAVRVTVLDRDKGFIDYEVGQRLYLIVLTVSVFPDSQGVGIRTNHPGRRNWEEGFRLHNNGRWGVGCVHYARCSLEIIRPLDVFSLPVKDPVEVEVDE